MGAKEQTRLSQDCTCSFTSMPKQGSASGRALDTTRQISGTRGRSYFITTTPPDAKTTQEDVCGGVLWGKPGKYKDGGPRLGRMEHTVWGSRIEDF